MLQVTCDKSIMATSSRLNILCAFFPSLFFVSFCSLPPKRTSALMYTSNSSTANSIEFPKSGPQIGAIDHCDVVVYVIFVYNISLDLGKHLFGNKFHHSTVAADWKSSEIRLNQSSVVMSKFIFLVFPSSCCTNGIITIPFTLLAIQMAINFEAGVKIITWQINQK